MSGGGEVQGWYYNDPSSEAMRVRLSIVDGTLALHTLSDRLIACWSLDQLENRGITVLAERWRIDYRAVRENASQLSPVRAVLWRQLGFSAIEAGKAGDWLVVLMVMIALAAAALWQLL